MTHKCYSIQLKELFFMILDHFHQSSGGRARGNSMKYLCMYIPVESTVYTTALWSDFSL